MIEGAKPRRARRAGVAGLAAAALLTAGCTAGQHAQTADEQETLDGTTVHVGQYVTLGGLAFESPTSGSSWAKGSSVPLRVVLVNSGRADDQLTSITSSSIGSWGAFASASAASAPSTGGTPAPVALPALSRFAFGTGLSNRVLQVSGVKAPLYPGSSIQLTFTFAKAGTVTAQVPVQLSKTPPTAVVPGPSATGQEG